MATTDPLSSSQSHPPSPSSFPPLTHKTGTDLITNVAMETRSDENHKYAKEFHSNHTIHAQPKEAPIKPWCSLLKSLPPSAGSVELHYVEPIFKGSENILKIEEEILKEGAMEWEQKIVGFFLDKKLPFSIVKEKVLEKWKLSGSVDIALDGEMFYFTFNNDDDREKVVDEGSFHMMGKLFVVRPWTREIEENRGAIRSIPLWVKLFNVPKHLWNPKGFSSLLSSLGRPLFMDKAIEKRQMLTFARVCVEVKAEKILPTELKVRINTEKVVSIPLEYPWQPMLCTKCKVFGHSLTNCERHKVKNSKEDLKGKGVQNPGNTNAGGAGPSNVHKEIGGNQNMRWSMVKKPTHTTLVEVHTDMRPSLSNRFATLNEEDDEIQVNGEKGEVVEEGSTLNQSMDVNEGDNVNVEAVVEVGSMVEEAPTLPTMITSGVQVVSIDQVTNDGPLICHKQGENSMLPVQNEIPSRLVEKEANVIMATLLQSEASAPTNTHEPVRVVSDVELGISTPSVAGSSKTAQHIYFKSPSSVEVVGLDESCYNEEFPETQLDGQLARAAEDWADMIVQEEGEWTKGKKRYKKLNWKEKARMPLSR